MILQERIQKLIEYSKMSIPKFAQYVGFKTPQAVRELLSGRTKTLSDSAKYKITQAFPEIDKTWLFTGEGGMLRRNLYGVVDVNPVTAEYLHEKGNWVPLINIDSVGGVWSSNEITQSEQYVEKLIPFLDARSDDVAIYQLGGSMSPTIPSGSILQLRKVEGWQEYFGYGQVYVLWLADDRRITKLVKKSKKDAKKYVLCCSYNPEANDEELPRSFIQEVWKVVNILVTKGW